MKVLVGDGCGNRFALIDAGAMGASDLSPGLVLHQCRDMDIDGLLVLDGVKLSIYNADGSDGGCPLLPSQPRVTPHKSGSETLHETALVWETTETM